MAVLSISRPPASANYFNTNVPDFCCAKRIFDNKGVRDVIDNLREIFLQHEMEEKYGLIMNHRHFLLNEGEILVETLKEGGKLSVAMPWRLEGQKVQPPTGEEWTKHGLENKAFVVPQTWAFTAEGALVPYEFISCNESEPEPDHHFVSNLFSALSSYGIESILGLRRLDDDRDGGAFEVTQPGSRVSLTSMGHIPEGFVMDSGTAKVLWYFARDGNTKEYMACNRCGTCGACCVII